MTVELKLVFVIISAATLLMASNRVRFDIVALLVVLALMLSGILTVGESLAGFGSPIIVLVAGLMVVGEMLVRTGVVHLVGDWILKKGGSRESRLLILIMFCAAALGAVMSSTAVVAIFIPIVLRIASATNINSSRMLLPMSYAALISGMLTLIGTTPNVVIHEELKGAGHQGFGFFSFSLLGITVLVVAIAYILLFGRRLLPVANMETDENKTTRSIVEMWSAFRSGEKLDQLQIQLNSSFIGQTIAETELESLYDVRILGILRKVSRREEIQASPDTNTVLNEQDVLLVIGKPDDHDRLIAEQGLERQLEPVQQKRSWMWEIGAATIMIHPESKLVGKSLRECGFRTNFNLHALGIRRGQEPIPSYRDVKLRSADSLFLVGPWSQIHSLPSQNHDFVVMEIPSEQAEVVPSYRKMPVALALLAGMVLLAIFDVIPLVAAVLVVGLSAVFTGCLTMEDCYRSIHWSSLVLIAGMLPLADALQVTGGTQLVVESLMSALGESSPYKMLSVLFFLTATLSLVLSNTASAVLVAPIAIHAASSLDVSPYPFAVAVLIAASAAYSTPISTPVVTLVVEPGGYKFIDFLKIGVPLLILTYLVTIVIAPLIFPFYPN